MTFIFLKKCYFNLSANEKITAKLTENQVGKAERYDP